MSTTRRTLRAARVVIGGIIGVVAVSAAAVGQGSRPRIGRAAQAPPQPTVTTPYPGASIIVPPTWYVEQQYGRPLRRDHRFPFTGFPAAVYYYPVPVSYPYYVSSGGGMVYDTNGRPLSSGFDASVPPQYEAPAGTPDLSGAPYVVLQGGAMLVDFGNGDRRTFPACAALASAQDPDGRPRTVFYSPATSGIILRAGARGQVRGAPTAGARACYAADAYGRMELRY